MRSNIFNKIKMDELTQNVNGSESITYKGNNLNTSTKVNVSELNNTNKRFPLRARRVGEGSAQCRQNRGQSANYTTLTEIGEVFDTHPYKRRLYESPEILWALCILNNVLNRDLWAITTDYIETQ